MLQFITLFSIAIALSQCSVVTPKMAKKESPAPLALDFSVLTKVGNLTVSDWRNKTIPGVSKIPYPEDINNVNYGYFLNVNLGSNKQKSSVILDTGSSDLWVPTKDYNSELSNTSEDTGNPFTITYLDGTTADGEYFTDDLTFDSGEPIVSLFEFAAANSEHFGVFGIADRNQESTQNKYDNLPWALQKAGVTPKASYSLYLGEDHGTGVIIFGGIDTEKFEGELNKYDIDPSANALSVDVKSVSVGEQQVTENAPYILDSGTTLALVSEELLAALTEVFQVGEDGTISCDQPDDMYISFDFGQNSVKVPYKDAAFPKEDGTCQLAFSYQGGNLILGDIFLRNAYVYYDLSDHTIALSQVKISDKSNIIVA